MSERKSYPSDLTDERWALIEPVLTAWKAAHPSASGHQGGYEMREIVNAILYQGRTGCQWEYLPHDLPPRSATYYYFAKWRDDGTDQAIHDLLRWHAREKKGRRADPALVVPDTQSVHSAASVPAETTGRDGRGEEGARAQAVPGGGRPGAGHRGRGPGGVGAREQVVPFLELLAPCPGDRVLEIGTGSGWTACLLAWKTGAAGHVTSVEVDPDVSARAAASITTTPLRPRLITGDGLAGAPDDAPFDRVHVTAGMEEVASQHRRGLAAKELPPGRAIALRRGRYPQPPQHPPHRRSPDLVAEAKQFALDPLVPPARVLPRHLLNQRRDLGVNRRASSPRRIGPPPAD
jgi:transposase